ncbi:hypothetical protein [Comamonas sp.]|uniref:hypothetical protein n=1 Tax=Comamonas sp. TaxID=34028 RepID=UPI00289D8606|nr:hypothetical protein [Comamonas sp.]
MPHPISTLGAVHTAISVLPLAAGLYSFVRYRAIEPAKRSGQLYLVSMLLSVLTAFGLSSTGGFNAGHALGILALLVIGGSLLIWQLPLFPRLVPYLSQFGFSFSFFLLLVPAIGETLTRLPVAHPLATGPESPLVRGTLLAWLAIFVVGSALQMWWMRSQRKR